MRWLIALSASVLLFGCAHPPPHEDLPTYSWSDDQTALNELSNRAHAVRTISAAALLTLTRPDGQSVRLDGALAISLPAKGVRLRAWKLGQAVFDLTLTPGGLWIETPKDAARHEQIAPASLSASQFIRTLTLFSGGAFERPGARVIDHGGPTFQVRNTLPPEEILVATVNRSTLAVRQYQVIDAAGGSHFDLRLRDYHLFNGLAWPTRLIARSDSGTIDAQLRDVELNTELPPAAFLPPHGAEKAP